MLGRGGDEREAPDRHLEWLASLVLPGMVAGRRIGMTPEGFVSPLVVNLSPVLLTKSAALVASATSNNPLDPCLGGRLPRRALLSARAPSMDAHLRKRSAARAYPQLPRQPLRRLAADADPAAVHAVQVVGRAQARHV